MERSHHIGIHILLADDHAMVLDGLYAALAQHSDMEIVGAVPDGREAVRAADVLRPDVVVLEATRRLVACCPASTVLALSLHTDTRLGTGMLEAGAAGYVLKGGGAPEVLRAIRLVAAGGTYLSPALRSMVGPPGNVP